MIVILLLVIIAGVALWYHRLHLMTRNPDAYEKYHRAERAFAKRQVEATERTARGFVAAIKALVRLVGRKFKKV